MRSRTQPPPADQRRSRGENPQPVKARATLTSAAATRNAAIRRDYRAGERLELLERRYGLGRVQLWRIINDVPNR